MTIDQQAYQAEFEKGMTGFLKNQGFKEPGMFAKFASEMGTSAVGPMGDMEDFFKNPGKAMANSFLGDFANDPRFAQIAQMIEDRLGISLSDLRNQISNVDWKKELSQNEIGQAPQVGAQKSQGVSLGKDD